ncbi:unnamed protein product [Paramecium sonneborni]|uniref:Uncharacterized protein n=1 Tax=Paramecium sonneborni TaxID=65129 RepID=A0A8S1PRG8_9CILI|nr:unnamed protein product [Paramecium sonneborni]
MFLLQMILIILCKKSLNSVMFNLEGFYLQHIQLFQLLVLLQYIKSICGKNGPETIFYTSFFQSQIFSLDIRIQVTNWFSIISLIKLEISQFLYCCVLIPSIQYLVQQRVLGTVFGILGIFTNSSMALFSILAGYILEKVIQNKRNIQQLDSFVVEFQYLFLHFIFFVQQSSTILDFVILKFHLNRKKQFQQIYKQQNNKQLEIFETLMMIYQKQKEKKIMMMMKMKKIIRRIQIFVFKQMIFNMKNSKIIKQSKKEEDLHIVNQNNKI